MCLTTASLSQPTGMSLGRGYMFARPMADEEGGTDITHSLFTDKWNDIILIRFLSDMRVNKMLILG